MQNHPQQFPDKFKNPDGSLNQEMLLASYTELERKQAGVDPTPAPVEPQPESVSAADASSTVAPGAATTMDELLRADPEPAKSAVDWEAIKNEVGNTGEISAETLAKAEAAGVPREAIAAAAAGWQAQAAAQMTRAAELVGGEEPLKATLAWAKQTYDAASIEALQNALRGPLGEQTLLGLHEAFKAANPESPLIDTGGSPPGPNQQAKIQPYRSYEEMAADMGKPEYKSNPDFQKHVAQRCAAGVGIDPKRFDT
jgi:hypothetical protein